MTPDQKRRIFQRLKTLSTERFWIEMNALHTRAYAKAEQHYQEAMSIVLTPKQKNAVMAKAAAIREQWDGMETVTIEGTADAVFQPTEVE